MGREAFNRKSSLKDQSVKEIPDGNFFDLLEITESEGMPLITCDFAEFDKYFKDEKYTEEQKIELLQHCWNFVIASMSLNLGIHPIQLANDNCGKLEENDTKRPHALSKLLDSGNNNNSVDVYPEQMSSNKTGAEKDG